MFHLPRAGCRMYWKGAEQCVNDKGESIGGKI